MSINGKGGVVHTDSIYFHDTGGGAYGINSEQRDPALLASNINADFDEAFLYATQQETQFYNLYFSGVTTYDEFIRKVRELFAKAGDDGQRIQSLSHTNLSKFVPPNITVSEEYTLTISCNGLSEDVSAALSQALGVPIEGTLELGLDTPKLVKLVLNDIEDRIGNKRFQEETPDIKTIKKYLRQILNGQNTAMIADCVVVNKSVSEAKVTETSKLQFKRGGFPFKWKKSEIKEFLASNPSADKLNEWKKNIQDAVDDIRNFIMNTCLNVNDGTIYEGAGNVLRTAAMSAWNTTIASKDIFSQDFFFEGENLTKSILGDMSEFQALVIDNYIALVTGTTGARLSEIIGNIVKDGRAQPRTDVQIIRDLGGDIGEVIAGIQVKNYGESSLESIDINTDLGLVAPNLGEGFADSVANTYFNTSIASQLGDMTDFLEKYLNAYFWKGMNVNVGANLDPRHTNTFYWVGGTKLVPASTILLTLKTSKKITPPTFTIDGLQSSGLGDADYNAPRPRSKPLFLKYWIPHDQATGQSTPTSLNFKTYEKYLRNIRIHTSFNMSEIIAQNQSFELFQ